MNLTAVEATQYAKGDGFGYFHFGGSAIILLFRDGVDAQIETSAGHRLVGAPVARRGRRRDERAGGER